MRKIIVLLMCLLGMSLSYANEVNIGVISGNDDTRIYLKCIPGYFFLNNNAQMYDNYAYENSDVVLYDCNLNPTTVHFNCENLDYYSYPLDCRYGEGLDDYAPLTQCFFNNDALYEGIAFDKGPEDKNGFQVRSNYRVINQNGDVLYTFEVPEGYDWSGYSYPYFYKVSDDIIIVKIDDFIKNDGTETYCDCYYSLKIGQSGVKAPIKLMHQMNLQCNPVAKGDDLVVTVGADAPQSTITVTSLSGMIVKEVTVVEGKATINTSDLPCGMYVVSQKGGASAKFIVK